MSRLPQPQLETATLLGERVLLRPLLPGDAEAAFDLIHGRHEITDWLLWDGPESLEELAPWYERWADPGPSGADYRFAICDRAGGQLWGTLGVRFKGHEYQADLGYWLAVERWGHGYMTEAVRMATWLCFEHVAAQLVYALAFEENQASARVLEKCGFERDPAGRSLVHKRGEPRVEEFFALSRRLWESRGCPGAPLEHDVRLRS
jgi:RimJ/RimL family protein N-acetyltransferase